MIGIARLLGVLAVLAVAAQQLVLYYKIVIMGNYVAHATIEAMIFVGVIWPIAVVAIAVLLIWLIVRYKPKSVNL